VVNLARLAAATRKRMRLVYAGEGATETSTRVVDPHKVIYAGGAFYIMTWSAEQQDWRRFRAERVIEAEVLDAGQTGEGGIEDEGQRIFSAPAEILDEVRVRFTPKVARWLTERYPDGEQQKDGSFVVTLRSASIDWAVRTVLQYGPEAEILSPPAYREAMRRAVA
jgi:predicted DNA-binding transcriptional regulator YafY